MGTPLTTRSGGVSAKYPVARKYAAALRWIVYLAVSCVVTICLWTPEALSDRLSNLRLEWAPSLAPSFVLLATLAMIFCRDVVMLRNAKGVCPVSLYAIWACYSGPRGRVVVGSIDHGKLKVVRT